MLRNLSFALVLCLAVVLPKAVNAQASPSAIVGVWRVTSVETREVASGRVVRPFGDHPTGTFVFTHGGRMVGMQFASNRKAPAGPNATEAERAALLSSMSAYSGTYRVEGKQLVMVIEDSSIQSWNGSTRTINIDIHGTKLTGTSESFRSLVTGLEVVAVIAWERLE